MNSFLLSIILKIILIFIIIGFYCIFFVIKTHISKKKKSLGLSLSLILLLSLTISYLHFDLRYILQNIQKHEIYKISNVTIIKDIDNNIIGKIGMQNKEYIYIQNVPPLILKTLINVEDSSFFANYGISLQNTFFNFCKALFTTKKFVGASTITQQLARNLFLSNKFSVLRKIKEIYIAIFLSYYLSKDYILELYINNVFFGKNTYGIQSAAKFFFNKELNEINHSEIAFLVGMIKGPSFYLKESNICHAMVRKNYVLNRMYHTGLINEEEYQNAKDFELNINYINQFSSSCSYIIENIKTQLQALKLSPEDGMIIHTSFQKKIQEISDKSLIDSIQKAEDQMPWYGVLSVEDESLDKYIHYETSQIKVVYLYRNGIISNNKNINDKLDLQDIFKYGQNFPTKSIVLVKRFHHSWFLCNPPQLNGAVLIVNPHTGRMISYVGGRGLKYSFWDGITQVKHSPGSICKIFTYLTAFIQNYKNDFILQDIPIYITSTNQIIEITENERNSYEKKDGKVMQNYDHKYLGPITLEDAFIKSRNIPIIMLSNLLGLNNIKKTIIKLGLMSKQEPLYLASVLGGGFERTIKDIVLALCALCNGGFKLNKLIHITKITDYTGNILYKEDEIQKEQILSMEVIDSMQNLCRKVILEGVAGKLKNIQKTLYGKTGTGQHGKTACFFVWSQDYLIYVLVYNNDQNTNIFHLWGRSLPLEIARKILFYLDTIPQGTESKD
jgi:penicillin-binding protein 1A